jgi:branched-chain amino acid transport system substrate-binding protein
MRRTSLLLALLLVLVTVLAGCGATKFECTDGWGCISINKGETIQIAYVGPMTGDYSAFGIDISRGATLAVKAVPEVKGFKIELLIQDTQGAPDQGAAVANLNATNARLAGVVGHTFSGETEASLPIYEAAHIVTISPSTTRADLPPKGPTIYNRVAFSDKLQGEMAANYVYTVLGIKKVVVMHDGGAYGKGLVEGMAAAFTKLGGEVLGMQGITPGETDYSAPLADVAALGPELIYYGGYDADAAVIVSQMAAAGLENAKFFGCDGTYGVNYLDLAGPAAEGTYSTYVPIPPTAAFDKFKADYQADFGDPQGKLSPFSPHGYDGAAILIAAIDKVSVQSGSSLIIPRKALAEAVRSTKDFPGLTGTLTNNGAGEMGAGEPQFMVVKNGAWEIAPGQ